MEGHLVGPRGPQTGARGAVHALTSDADDGVQQTLPVRVEGVIGQREDLHGADLLPSAVAILRLNVVRWGGAIAQRPDRAEQAGLVAFDLGDEDGSTIPCRLESFFDSAWRRR